MDIGKLNKIVHIQKRTMVIDENGFQVESWTKGTKCHAMVTNIHGKELLNNIEQMSNNTYKRIKIRYKEYLDETKYFDVTHDYRIKYNNSYWNITSIDDIKDRHEYMEILITKIEGDTDES